MDSHNLRLKIFDLLPSDWHKTTRQISWEFCSFYANSSSENIDHLISISSTEDLLNSSPMLALENILSPLSFASDDPKSAWANHSLDSVKSGQHLSLSELSHCASLYMIQGKERSPSLELWLIRKMIYEEAYAFQEELSQILKPKTILGRLVSFAPAISHLAAIFSSIWIAAAYGLAIGFAAYLVLHTCLHVNHRDRTSLQRHLLQALTAIKRCYSAAMQEFPSPLEIERLLLIAERADAAWPHHLHDLVEQAKRRNFYKWT